jgi:hypothetical protein
MSDEDYDEVINDVGDEREQLMEQIVDPELEKLAVSLVRACLFLNMNNYPLHRQNLKKTAFGDESINSRLFDNALTRADQILKDVYGYVLREMPPKVTTNAQGKKSVSKTRQWTLLNILKDGYLRFHQESQWLRMSTNLFTSELMYEKHDYRDSKEKYPHLNTDEDLTFMGLAITVIMIVVVNNNHMNEIELLQVLNEHFGVAITEPLPILSLTPVEFLRHLDKQEYVNRTMIKADNEEVVEYSIGRRGLLELDRETFTELTQILFDEHEERPEFTKLVDATIEAAYDKKPVEVIPEE